MSRPKKQLPPAKTKQLHIRFTEKQYDTLVNDAASAGPSISEYIRRLVTNRKVTYAPTVVHDDSAILEALHSINHLGSNLNQIAQYLNSGGNMTRQHRTKIVQ